MKKAIVLVGAIVLAPILFLVFALVLVASALVVATGAANCSAGGGTDGSPTILGPPSATAAQLIEWWTHQPYPDPVTTVNTPIEKLVALYLDEGAAEGVRGDIAFAQSILETGGFTSRDARQDNNFAGIAHYDNAPFGQGFPDPQTGIRAQMQLLHRFASGNDIGLANGAVAPKAGARANTWKQLGGTWATAPSYWTSIDELWTAMTNGTAADGAVTAALCAPSDATARSGQYALPLPPSWYEQRPDWFSAAHHCCSSAIDIPVPTGTEVYSAAAGTVISAPTEGACGKGLIIRGDDGVEYGYCHGSDGGVIERIGDHVEAGQLIMHSASTGRSTGPHLHFQIRAAGQWRCPQQFLVQIARGQTPDPYTLAPTGCTA